MSYFIASRSTYKKDSPWKVARNVIYKSSQSAKLAIITDLWRNEGVAYKVADCDHYPDKGIWKAAKP
mgnify:FL=1|tara:strand:+ start:69 stop:269 length:201 start_codon:yes stop_codon:yes gene_type:complete